MVISVNSTKCIGCNRCVEVCPSGIFVKSDAKYPNVENISRCIVCGHCAAICPTDSVEHLQFPKDKVHAINPPMLPNAEQTMELIRSRRSTRAFTDTPVPSEFIEQILEAAHRAPTASNSQKVEFTIVTSTEKLKQISLFTADTFFSIVKKLQNPLLKPILKIIMPGAYKYVPTFSLMKSKLESGNDMILRGATAVLFIHTPSSALFGKEDANLAYQNASLMAESLGVGQFYTGFVCSASMRTKHKSLAKILGIEGNVYAGMAIGMPKFKFQNYIDKNDIVVNYL